MSDDYVSGGGEGQQAFDWPIDPNFTNFNVPAIQNPYELAMQRAYFGEGDDQVSAQTLIQFKDLYTPAELNAIVDDYVSSTGDKEGAVYLKNLLGSDTALSDLALAEAGKIPAGTGDIASSGDTNFLSRALSNISGSDLLKYGLPALGSYLSYKSAKDAQTQARGVSLGKNAPVTATKVSGKGVRYSAAGGLQSLAQGGKSSLPPRYLDGHTDGMADKVPAHIDNRRPAALSDGEFVIPADVVSHLGNGNSTAGAKRLYEMMDRIRSARTGTTKQGKQINPDKFLPR